MHPEELYNKATMRNIPTPGLIALTRKVLGICQEPIHLGQAGKIVVPKQESLKFLSKSHEHIHVRARHSVKGEECRDGMLVVHRTNHQGFFIPD